MKKMLFMAVLVIGGGAFLKNNMVVTPNGQVRISGWTVPIPAVVQNSPIYGMVTMLASMSAQSGGTTDQRRAAGQQARPTAAGQSGDQFSAVAKALRGQ